MQGLSDIIVQLKERIQLLHEELMHILYTVKDINEQSYLLVQKGQENASLEKQLQSLEKDLWKSQYESQYLQYQYQSQYQPLLPIPHTQAYPTLKNPDSFPPTRTLYPATGLIPPRNYGFRPLRTFEQERQFLEAMFFPQLRKKPNMHTPSSSQCSISSPQTTPPPITVHPSTGSQIPKQETQMFQNFDTESDVVASSVPAQMNIPSRPLNDMSSFLKNLTKEPEVNLQNETQSSDDMTDTSETFIEDTSSSSMDSESLLMMNPSEQPSEPDPLIEENLRPPNHQEPQRIPTYGDSSKGFTIDDIPPS
ncbi:uncharacterized protein LOC110007229 [Amborella trichopoda]|uniref:uncharacterized protein LOC110007229 n=1 Tax=Amborella trichopoda TaxID=13333 RepID=UPI0009C03588|nr:uncharacterized protein LOC110007229 [Amborella trichopoda]|eukprot:XP_020522665.1 uncharacterized protein LOC110007229 [Amborella trichopoda]